MDAPPRDPDRFALVGSVILLAFVVPFAIALGVLAVTRATPALLPVFIFGALCALGLAFIGAMAPWRVVRDRRLRAEFSRVCARCPGCGLLAATEARCVWCAMPLDDRGARWRVDPPLWIESAAGIAIGLGVISLGVFLGSAPFVHAVRGGVAVLLALMGAGAALSGGSIASIAARSLRAQWRRPPSLTLQRTWERAGGLWSANAKAVLTEAGWRVEGSCEGLADEPTGGVATSDDPFARGLARALAAWDRDGRAPIVCVTVAKWSWSNDAAGPAADAGAYRGAPDASDPGLRRAVSHVWRVSFNAHGFGELLDAEGLRAGPAAPDDDEAAELSEAEWDVDVAMVARVTRRDEALRAAIVARGSAADPDGDAAVARALRAVLAG